MRVPDVDDFNLEGLLFIRIRRSGVIYTVFGKQENGPSRAPDLVKRLRVRKAALQSALLVRLYPYTISENLSM